MVIWNKDSNIADDLIRVVKFDFATNMGPGSVTTIINKGVSMDNAKMQLLDEITAMGGNYTTIEIVDYEILEILDDDSPMH